MKIEILTRGENWTTRVRFTISLVLLPGRYVTNIGRIVFSFHGSLRHSPCFCILLIRCLSIGRIALNQPITIPSSFPLVIHNFNEIWRLKIRLCVKAFACYGKSIDVGLWKVWIFNATIFYSVIREQPSIIFETFKHRFFWWIIAFFKVINFTREVQYAATFSHLSFGHHWFWEIHWRYKMIVYIRTRRIPLWFLHNLSMANSRFALETKLRI